MSNLLSSIRNGIIFVVRWIAIVLCGIGAIIGICGMGYFFFLPFGALLKQCVQYLVHGIWEPYSIADHFGWIYPNSMYGLHNILDGINAVFLSLLIVPCLIWTIYAVVGVVELIGKIKSSAEKSRIEQKTAENIKKIKSRKLQKRAEI